MDPRGDPSVLPHGPSTMSVSPLATVGRRLSMDEDFFYHRVMTTPQPRPSCPPPYRPDAPRLDESKGRPKSKSKGKGKVISAPSGVSISEIEEGKERLPGYWNSINLEGVFMRKHEIEDTTKRAEDRRWHTTYVTLNGTALNIHKVKKDRSWGRTQDGPSISPDNPPWVKKSKLEKSYSLLYADAGIAADYKKRRYVIRIRAETDQFLISCIELSTFNRWLQGLFSAIDVALPIDDRDFPRDMSIPRVQRVRWYRGFSPEYSIATSQPLDLDEQTEESPTIPPRRRSSSPDPLPNLDRSNSTAQQTHEPTGGLLDDEEDKGLKEHAPVFDEEDENNDGGDDAAPPPRLEPTHRLSTTSYDNVGINPHSGKWVPDHQWTSAHDLLYAKLCYSNLLFRSPRKSNYIISKGKKWYVDWGTGRMVRVLPPAYGEVDYFGPWQVVHTENMHI